MASNHQCNVQYIPYKEIDKQKALEYYHKNKEKIKERAKNNYNSKNKEWFKKQPTERQQELKEKAKQYHKNRYHNLMIAVN